jgi:hypothetical protein
MRLAVFAFALIASACAAPPAIEPQQAEGDARVSIARNDHRLVGVYGYATEVPGATPMDEERLGVRFIEGTSDMPASAAESEFNTRARQYAARYNTVILAPHD